MKKYKPLIYGCVLIKSLDFRTFLVHVLVFSKNYYTCRYLNASKTQRAYLASKKVVPLELKVLRAIKVSPRSAKNY